MSIETELNVLSENVTESYSAVEEKGGTLPENKNMNNLPNAIRSINGESISRPSVINVLENKESLDSYSTENVIENDIIEILKDETQNDKTTFYRYENASETETEVLSWILYATQENVQDSVQNWEANQSYKANELLVYNNELYIVTTDFQSGDTFSDSNLSKVSENIKLYDSYINASDGANTAAFINSSLKGRTISLGASSSTGTANTSSYAIAIGYGAKANYSTTLSSSTAIGGNSEAYASSVALGLSSKSTNSRSVTIGNSSTSNKANTVAIGCQATTTYENSISIGYGSAVSRERECSIGQKTSNLGAPTRFLSNVTAGELDTDAVNVKQLKDTVGDIESILQAINGEASTSSDETQE